MAMIPPPEGLSAEDYDAIEAAVVETVRGRWFLAEYARRSRVEEVRQMLDGLARLELTVREQQQLPADPSIRLLVQRLKDVSQKLETIAGGMRADGVEAHYCADVETQARAVSGLLRSAPQVKLDTPRVADVALRCGRSLCRRPPLRLSRPSSARCRSRRQRRRVL